LSELGAGWEARVSIFFGFFGEECDVRGLSEQDPLAFVQKRLAGAIVAGKDKRGKEKLTTAVRARSAQADVEVFHSMLHWATTFRVRAGVRLLERNSLEGVKLPNRGSNFSSRSDSVGVTRLNQKWRPPDWYRRGTPYPLSGPG
jgi:hypothetical protein